MERILAVIVVIVQLAGCSARSSLPKISKEPISTIELSNDSTTANGFWLGPQLAGAVHDNLQANGLNIPAHDIYNLNNSALNHALVRINNGQNHAGSGAFVSKEGLILTSYKTINQALSSLSTGDHEFENGFFAESPSREIPLPNYELHIPIEQYEVTQQINRFLPDTLTYRERQQWKQQIQQQLITSRKQGKEDVRVQINDFWSGNRQFLTVYKIIRDIRLVHIPSESIALFGNKNAHWQWPQYRGHYAFLRAYVGPNNQSSSYRQTNTSFKPDRFLTINSQKVQPGDFTLFMGFPQKTYRQESSYAFSFYHNVLNPVLLKSNSAIFNAQQHIAEKDHQQAIKTKASQNSISRNIDYYKAVQQQFDERDIIKKKQIFEQKLSQWIESDSLRNRKYGRALSQLEQAYDIASQTGDLLYALVYPLNNNKLMNIANLYDSYFDAISDSDQTTSFQAQKDTLLKRHQHMLESMNIEAQNMMLTDMLHTLVSLPEGKVIIYLIDLFGDTQSRHLRENIRSYLEHQQKRSIVYNIDRARQFLNQPINTLHQQPQDSMILLYQKLIEAYRFSRNNFTQHIRYLQPAQERYAAAISTFNPDQFNYPDGNLTMRVNGGKIQGFTSDDGTTYSPFTTLRDLNDAANDAGSQLPRQLTSSHLNNNPTICFLSSNDISHNNSGNIVLNSDGELIGLTIDRNSEGITSDYLYDPKHARSINLSTSYIIHLMKNVFETDRLLKEINYR